jgi:hypothetical protein
MPGGWRNEKLHNLYSSADIRVIKSTCENARDEKCTDLVGKTEGKRPCRRTSCRHVIKIDGWRICVG